MTDLTDRELAERLMEQIRKRVSPELREALGKIKPPPVQGIECQPEHAGLLACSWPLISRQFSDDPRGRFEDKRMEEKFLQSLDIITKTAPIPLGDFPIRVIWTLAAVLRDVSKGRSDLAEVETQEDFDLVLRRVARVASECLLGAFCEIVASQARERQLHETIGNLKEADPDN